MLQKILILLLLALFTELKAENPSLIYINKYKSVAISEMQRTGIPASIKMAQALLESGAGKSQLAREANNHFGIKCGGSWEGESFYIEDDDYKNGKKIKSCFRQFSSVHSSFIAHSDFLQNQPRYSFLFNLDKMDYEAWANGLKKAGYATDKKYPKKLIELIEKYELHELDNGLEDWLAKDDNKQNKMGDLVVSDNTVIDENHTQKDYFSLEEGRSTVNRKNQESKNTKRHKNNLKEEAVFHKVMNGERIKDIAQIYNVDEGGLRLRNRLPKDAEPLSGEKIFLRKKISLLSRPRFTRVPATGDVATNEFIF